MTRLHSEGSVVIMLVCTCLTAVQVGVGPSLDGYERLQSFTGPGSQVVPHTVLVRTALCSQEEERIKRKLKFFFFNPLEKYYATRKLPWKLCLQILKVFLVTAQLWIFAEYRLVYPEEL